MNKQKSTLKVAAVDFVPAWGDLEGNIKNVTEAVKKVAQEGVDYAVFPETSVSGYLFTDSNELQPYLDTIPGKTTAAILPILKEHNMYLSIGVAERDVDTHVPYNSAVLMGPEGIIGVYRKLGLNSQDQKVFAPGNKGIEVFETPIGNISLLICYDDTYWQYARVAALKGADIIGWHSVSDRMMPGADELDMLGDHSTVSHVQHMSAFNGVWTICATRSGIETNPITKKQLYYNGGSSIWNPKGEKVVQSPVVAPLNLQPGLHGMFTAYIDLEESRKIKKDKFLKRRPILYNPLLVLHRAPTDRNATTSQITTKIIAAQWSKDESKLSSAAVGENELLVLPEFSACSYFEDPQEILKFAEKRDGAFEQQLCAIAKKGSGYVVGSYPEIDVDKLYHTVVLAGPAGNVLARYRVTHLNNRDAGWATPGNEISVTVTPIGRIALAAAYELEIPELAGMYATSRADVLAAPAGLAGELKVQIDEHLYSVPTPPTNKVDYYPYAAATLNQYWVVSGGRCDEEFTAAGIYGPEPVVLNSTVLAGSGEEYATLETSIPAPFTWINQERLIVGQAAECFPPLVK